MNKNCENRYKLCRETAGITQEQAAELLNVSVRQLSDYENGKAKVSDDTVERMAHHYKSHLLAWWHLKHHSVLGKYLPEVMLTSTVGDMALQAGFAQDDLTPTIESARNLARLIISGAEWCADKKGELSQTVAAWDQVRAQLLSATIFAKQIIDG
ncbi:MAG: helix-turn-helix transcriptional regulator [Defluviitaleaceae bacterium]|nr:helix-turn-helix transcriptional regulator [Defluviitaleaceae bacterium]